MITLLLFAMQATTQAPDLELNVRVRARTLTIEKQGDAHLAVTTSPAGENLVDVQAPKSNGRRTLKNIQVDVRVEARVADPHAQENDLNQTETAPKG